MSDFYKKYSIEVSSHGILAKATTASEFTSKHMIDAIQLQPTAIVLYVKEKQLILVSSDNSIILEEIYKYIMKNLYEINI